MKKLKCIAALCFLMISPVLACSDKRPQDATVAQARGFKDDTLVRIQGTLESMIAHEWYIFSDRTGRISVEIETKVWIRAGINPTTLVLPAPFQIIAEVDKKRNQETTLEVERIRHLVP